MPIDPKAPKPIGGSFGDRRELRSSLSGMSPSAVVAKASAMVGEMLRPILKDWLDANLPYLIERMVKKEIERMVDRSTQY